MTYYLLMLFMLGNKPHMTAFPMESADERWFVVTKVAGNKEMPKNASFVCVELAPEGDPT